MPVYEYWCQGCGKEVEKLVKSIERELPLVSCPDCGARMTKKVGSIAHFEFKGAMA